LVQRVLPFVVGRNSGIDRGAFHLTSSFAGL
jgi:hypothetical protein